MGKNQKIVICRNLVNRKFYESVLKDIKRDAVMILEVPAGKVADEYFEQASEFMENDSENVCIVVSTLTQDKLRELSYYCEQIFINTPEQIAFLQYPATKEIIIIESDKFRIIPSLEKRSTVDSNDDSLDY